MDEQQLDNPVWWSLRRHHADFAIGSTDGSVLRYQPAVSLFGATATFDDDSWPALGNLADPGAVVGLFRAAVGPVSDDWVEVYRGEAVQMIAPALDEDEPAPAVRELSEDDAADMLALARDAQPGPFEERTHRLGRFVGVHRQGRLVAMAGERFRVDGATEISAVCTAEPARGTGLGALVTLDVVRSIQARGDVAFLHVESTNEPALRLYQRLGFSVRCHHQVVVAVRRD